MARAYIALGANLEDPPGKIREALERIRRLPQVDWVATSSLYRSRPVGPGIQPAYCNAVCAVESHLAAPDLLGALQGIEQDMGRTRGGERWAARVIDLDLLHVEGECVDTAGLVLPHPQLASRNFVLVPLAEVDPHLVIDGLGKVATMAQAIGQEGLARWSPP